MVLFIVKILVNFFLVDVICLIFLSLLGISIRYIPGDCIFYVKRVNV